MCNPFLFCKEPLRNPTQEQLYWHIFSWKLRVDNIIAYVYCYRLGLVLLHVTLPRRLFWFVLIPTLYICERLGRFMLFYQSLITLHLSFRKIYIYKYIYTNKDEVIKKLTMNWFKSEKRYLSTRSNRVNNVFYEFLIFLPCLLLLLNI